MAARIILFPSDGSAARPLAAEPMDAMDCLLQFLPFHWAPTWLKEAAAPCTDLAFGIFVDDEGALKGLPEHPHFVNGLRGPVVLFATKGDGEEVLLPEAVVKAVCSAHEDVRGGRVAVVDDGSARRAVTETVLAFVETWRE